MNIPTLVDDWITHLQSRNRSPLTQVSYRQTLTDFHDFLTDAGLPSDADAITRHHIEAYMRDCLDRYAPSTAHRHHGALKLFFKWLVLEEEISLSPMEKTQPPTVPESPVPVLADQELAALLATCASNTFDDRRDTAILRVLIDTGMRIGELAGMSMASVDLPGSAIEILGKGSRIRLAPFGAKTSDALRRYLRARARHASNGLDAFWLGRQGAFTGPGIRQMIERRGREAGVEGVHPHRFRHSAAHAWLAAGGQEGDLMRLLGWRSREMLSRYAASAADDRAREAHKRMRLGDRL